MSLRDLILNLPPRSQAFKDKLQLLYDHLHAKGDSSLDQFMVELADQTQMFDTMELEIVNTLEALDSLRQTTTLAQLVAAKTAIRDLIRSIRTISIPEDYN